MADHVRKQLREAVAAAVTSLTTTGSRVSQSRVYALETDGLPALIVTTDGEDASPLSVHALDVERAIDVAITGYAAAASDLDDTLDLIAKEVEIALANGVTISAKVIPLYYDGCEIEFDGEGEKPKGSITLRYKATAFTAAGVPDAFL